MKKHSPLSTLHSPFQGMTLVELLVVISIMVILMAISVPNLKPMLDAQQQHNAAQLLSATLEKARLMSMESNNCFGVTFERYRTEGNTSNADGCVSFFISRISPVSQEMIPGDVRGYLHDGVPTFYVYQKGSGGKYEWSRAASNSYSLGNAGRFQIGGREIYYDGSRARDVFNNTVYSTFPDWDDLDATKSWGEPSTLNLTNNSETPPAVFHKTSRAFRPTFAPPMSLPRETVLDLRWSGTSGDSQFFTNYDCFRSSWGPITIMFSPAGHVDRVIFGNNANAIEYPVEPIHLLVGKWDQLSSHGDSREDIRDNFEMESNYWVSIEPRSGLISVSEVNPVKIVRDGSNTTYDSASYPQGYTGTINNKPANFFDIIRYTRQFANDFHRNYGGF